MKSQRKSTITTSLNKAILLFLLASLLIVAACVDEAHREPLSIIPLPSEVYVKNGSFSLSAETQIVADEDALESAQYLKVLLRELTDLNLNIGGDPVRNSITLTIKDLNPDSEEYSLIATKQGIKITAHSNKGLFYGIQTLHQLLIPEIGNTTGTKKEQLRCPAVEVHDKPAHQWRGFMLDCVRHFFPKSFIKELIDHLAARKMNVLHLHLTDHQGWRIEIKKYPKLTTTSAWRVTRDYTQWLNSEFQQPGEIADYGGFYTQEDIREIVEYARERHITVIPEIEMPSHTTAVFAAYPQFSCAGKKITVPPAGRPLYCGLFSDMPEIEVSPNIRLPVLYCAGNDSTFIFLQDVLTEVMELFPSEYIHIGGDEAHKRIWELCPKCQQRIDDENLSGVDELQSYFIKRMQRFIESKGRIMIGWDEILHDNPEPPAAIMVWHPNDSLDLKAAQKGLKVIMSPTTHCYFDAYQGPRHMNPPALGNHIPLSKVYDFSPVSEYLDKEMKANILGGQANLWTEYVPDRKQAEYKIFPRIEAMAEVLWTTSERKNFTDFRKRLIKRIQHYEKEGVNYSKNSMLVTPNISLTHNKEICVEFSTELKVGDIYYTTDGSVPSENDKQYKSPFTLNDNTTVKAVQIKSGEHITTPSTTLIAKSKAIGAKIEYAQEWHWRYPAISHDALTNGKLATKDTRHGQWVGFKARPSLEFTVDLGELSDIGSVKSGFLQSQKDFIAFPTEVEYHLSKDGINFKKVESVTAPKLKTMENYLYRFPIQLNEQAQYIKLITKGVNELPEKPLNGGFQIFIDEIIVE